MEIKLISPVKFFLFIMLFAFASSANAEYYLVYPMPDPFACGYCSGYPVKVVHQKKYKKTVQYKQKTKKYKRSRVRITAQCVCPFYPCGWMPACQRSRDYVTFSAMPTSYRGATFYVDDFVTYDMRTGDDDVYRHPDMQVTNY
ncbi:hypothetical protein [Aquicella lusitana]|uniref:Uncharacterized protein n=1 Tax=Aquicella lusitana TaxID=254246 RepID=A0A370GAN8_9COXI|nr:hypothetical protein [Aquicella lusitana]RDI39053.1 hypothetical protein C8D86_1299 [Aquicella lusitana]VVC73660.1 hypothetical protein AQULUS_14070 [Aquicella lusitana]